MSAIRIHPPISTPTFAVGKELLQRLGDGLETHCVAGLDQDDVARTDVLGQGRDKLFARVEVYAAHGRVDSSPEQSSSAPRERAASPTSRCIFALSGPRLSMSPSMHTSLPGKSEAGLHGEYGRIRVGVVAVVDDGDAACAYYAGAAADGGRTLPRPRLSARRSGPSSMPTQAAASAALMSWRPKAFTLTVKRRSPRTTSKLTPPSRRTFLSAHVVAPAQRRIL